MNWTQVDGQKLLEPVVSMVNWIFSLAITLILFLRIIEPRHDKTNIMGLQPAWIQKQPAQSDHDPCCSLTYPITSRETDSEQHGT
jgi:hypothetical protein